MQRMSSLKHDLGNMPIQGNKGIQGNPSLRERLQASGPALGSRPASASSDTNDGFAGGLPGPLVQRASRSCIPLFALFLSSSLLSLPISPHLSPFPSLLSTGRNGRCMLLCCSARRVLARRLRSVFFCLLMETSFGMPRSNSSMLPAKSV